jgi:tetratricopeptide (TPR) repeat protein
VASKNFVRIIFLLIIVNFPVSVFAETLILKSGQKIEGKIIEKTDKSVKIDFFEVPITYFLDEIESIDGVKIIEPNKAALEDAESYYKQGEKAFNSGDFGQAISDFTKAIEINPSNLLAYGSRGSAYYFKNEFNQAIADFNKVIALKPDTAKGYYCRGLAYAKKGDNEKALDDFNKAIELNPRYNEAYGDRGLLYYLRNDFDQAIKDFSKVIEIIPNADRAYYARGVAYAKKNDLGQAISDFTKAIEIKPNYADPYNDRALAYFYKKDYGNAWQDTHKAQELGFKVSPRFIQDLKSASEGKNTENTKEEYGLQKEPDFNFQAPPQWTAASKKLNPEYYSRLIAEIPSLRQSIMFCFPAQDNFYNFVQNPVPLILVTGKVRNIEGADGVAIAKSMIDSKVNKHKEIIAERIDKGLHTKTEIGFGIIPNNLGEDILRIPQIKENAATRQQIISFLYDYNHISKDKTKLYSYSILATCMLVDGEKYIDIFDDFAKNFVAKD